MISRRSLMVGGACIPIVAVASCSNTASAPGPARRPAPSGDADLLRLLAALENAAITGYHHVAQAAGSGRYGSLPAGVAEFLGLATSHHSQHLAIWNGALAGLRQGPQEVGESSLEADIRERLRSAGHLDDLLGLAVLIEGSLAETQVVVSSRIGGASHARLIASICPIEAQHQAIARLALGQIPVDGSRLGKALARVKPG